MIFIVNAKTSNDINAFYLAARGFAAHGLPPRKRAPNGTQ